MPREPNTFEYQMIPSEPKEPGWQAFLQARHTLLNGKPRSTSRVLPILHRLTTHDVPLEELPPEITAEAVIRVLMDEGYNEYQAIMAYQEILRNDFLKALNDGSGGINGRQYRMGILRRGHLRSFGKREDPDTHELQTVFAAHAKPINDGLFVGLEKGLDETLGKVCEMYDRMMQEAKPLDEKLAAIIFFQLWGASVIHPFWDANGRTFAAHLVLSLNSIGFETDKMPGFPELHEIIATNALAGIGPSFLNTFLGAHNLPLVTREQLLRLTRNKQMRTIYMRLLREAIENDIACGMQFTEPLRPFRDGAMMLLKAWLSREHLTDQGEYYTTRLPFFRETIAREEAMRSGI